MKPNDRAANDLDFDLVLTAIQRYTIPVALVIWVSIPSHFTNSVKNEELIWAKVRYVSEETYRERVKRLEPRAGDIVFGREGSVSESVVVRENMRCCLGHRVMLSRPFRVVTARFFQLALLEPSSLRRLLSLHKGIGEKHVNVGDMRNALLPVPPLAEQHRIVAKVDELIALCHKLETQLTIAQTDSRRLLEAVLRDTLAPALAEAA